MYKEITSIQNSLIKEILSLQEKSRSRKQSGLFCIEGKREISLAIKGSYQLRKILFCEEIFHSNELNQYNFNGAEIIKISKDVYQK